MKRCFVYISLFCVCILSTGCRSLSPEFTIISGSENRSLEPLIRNFGRKHFLNIKMEYMGSLDIMMALQNGTLDADAVWPANSLWIPLTGNENNISHLKSIMRSPVVFGIRHSRAEQLGLIDKDVQVRDILDLIKAHKLSFMMTSATQSNSGASGFLGFAYALSGNPDLLTIDDLKNPALQKDLAQLLSGINRTAESSGWLRDIFMKGIYDAMINYESIIIETNILLQQQGKETLYCVYPEDAIVMSDSPLGFIHRGDNSKEKIFLKLQDYLLSDPVQERILHMGRRKVQGEPAGDTYTYAFKREWGVDFDRTFSPVAPPDKETIRYALNLYQTKLRKPSYTVYCLDFSASMAENGEEQLREAMTVLLEDKVSERYLLSSGERDVSVIIAFSDKIIQQWTITGNDGELELILDDIFQTRSSGSTDIYTPILAALELLHQVDSTLYIPSIILMTDGVSNAGRSYSHVEAYYKSLDMDIPVFSIMFGEANRYQLDELAELGRGRVFDGRKDLINAFRRARRYN